MKLRHLFVLVFLVAGLVGCSGYGTDDAASAERTFEEITVTDAELEGNPFRMDWDTPYGVPPFSEIEDEHFMPAIKKGILEGREDIEAIAENAEAPTFENTVVALELSAEELTKASRTFFNIVSTELNDELRSIQGPISAMLSKERSAMMLNDDLFKRVQAVHEQVGELDLDEQDARLVELWHRAFVRAGAALDEDAKKRVAEINVELAELTTEYGQNLLKATKGFSLELKDEDHLVGLSDDFKASIWNEEKEAYVVGLNRSAYETFMTQSEVRELREQLFNGYRLRASEGEIDNGPLAIRIAQLRAERARLMGYDSHAHYQLETRMAKTPKGAEDFLLQVWRPGLERAKEELADMQAMVGDEFTIAGHDWWHYSEKVRLERYALDENLIKPYFDLEKVRAGAFDMATKLFGVTLEPVEVEGWNEVVTAYDVKDDDGSHLGLFMMDMYARDSKRGGAWMSGFRAASNIDGKLIRPIVTNNMNLSTPPEGEPTLMRFSEVETLFHEFGHGLHGLLTRIDYPMFSGVDGPRDYTEFPAQILEHWASQPELLERFARHYETGEVIPQELVERMQTAANHNEGFRTTEYVAASLLDLRWHMLTVEEANALTDAREFEQKVLREYGLIDEIEPRYRSQYFSHIFAGGYSAGYYAYLWSEILDADGFAAFEEAEDIWDPRTAARLKKWVYQSGGLREADELYRNFRGKDPSIRPLLEGRGFKATGSGASAGAGAGASGS